MAQVADEIARCVAGPRDHPRLQFVAPWFVPPQRQRDDNGEPDDDRNVDQSIVRPVVWPVWAPPRETSHALHDEVFGFGMRNDDRRRTDFRNEVEFFGERAMAVLRAAFGKEAK